MPTAAVGLAWTGFAVPVAGEQTSGGGAILDAALGRRRWQGFAELGVIRLHDHLGELGRGGLGVRWLARQWVPQAGGAVEMFLSSGAGLERYWWRDGSRALRPDVFAGVGLQLRALAFHGLTFRYELRVVFAPTEQPQAMVACRGDCAMPGASSSGFEVRVGLAW